MSKMPKIPKCSKCRDAKKRCQNQKMIESQEVVSDLKTFAHKACKIAAVKKTVLNSQQSTVISQI